MTQSSRQVPTDPSARLGIYKRLEDVPDRYRLEHHADAYSGRDVWGEFIEYEQDRYGYDSEQYLENSERCGRYWREHMDERGRHHALATPEDVETFMASLLERMQSRTAYDPYWARLESFYAWLQWHTEHPHRYHPVLMAVIEYPTPRGAAGRVWEAKLASWKGRNDHE